MDAILRDATPGGDTFAANRATGKIVLAVDATRGITRRARVHETGSLRVRFPNGHGSRALDAVIVNTAGGMTGGDRFEIAVDVGPEAALSVTTVAAEKVYRSIGPDTEVGVRISVGERGALAWLPQETILFDRLRLRRTIEIDVAADGHLVLAEAIVFGRAAMGEVVRHGYLFDRRRVRVAGALVFAETFGLEGAIAQRLADTAIAAGGAAVASVLRFPGDDGLASAAREMQQGFSGEVGISCWNGLAVARLVARDGATLRRDLVTLLGAWGADPLPRLWVN